MREKPTDRKRISGARLGNRDLRRQPEVEPGQRAGKIYGVLPVLEALRAESRKVERVLIAEGAREKRFSEILGLCRERSVAWSLVPREALAKYVDIGANHQGVIAFAAQADYVSADVLLGNAGKDALLLVLDGIEDPRNLGAILRVADCAGVNGVIIPERRAVGVNETVAKSSAGAVEHVQIAKVSNLNSFIEKLKDQKVWVIGTSLDTEMEYTSWDWTQPSALILGGEGKGLHRLVAENCDVLVKIPMHGKIDSLNVSVAAGVILFEARRQRSGKHDPS